jgi:allantoin racemase
LPVNISSGSPTIKILDLFPLVYTSDLSESMKDRQSLNQEIQRQTGGNVELLVESLDFGTSSLEGEYDEALNTPFILERAKVAEENGVSAIVIDCFGDPGLFPARELVRIPVVGANQASVNLAIQLGNKFSIINIVPETEGVVWSLAAKYGAMDRLASVKTIDVPVLELERSADRSVRAAAEAVVEAVRKDGADVAVFGCTGMSSFISKVKRDLLKLSIDIPLVEPLRAAVYTSITLSLSGLSHSKKAFMYPRAKARKMPAELKALELSLPQQEIRVK